MLALAEVAVRSNHNASVTICHAMIQVDVLLQSPLMVFVATRRYLLCQLRLLSKEFGFIFRRALHKQFMGIDGEMLVGAESLVQQLYQLIVFFMYYSAV